MTTRQYHNTLLERLSDEGTLTIGIGRRSEMQIDCTYCGHHNTIVMRGGSLGSYQVTCSLCGSLLATDQRREDAEPSQPTQVGQNM